MKVDVTNTQTGQEPEVSQISKDTSRFEKNVSLPTDPPAPSSGIGAVAGKSVNAAVNAAQASIKEDLGPEGESAESVVK